MPREPGSNPRNADLRALFLRSGNRCAFAGCDRRMATDRQDFVGQVCHIAAAAAGGPRFDASMAPEIRGASENLILLCYEHHVEVDAHEDEFPADRLREMKARHEATATAQPFEVADSVIETAESQLDEFMTSVRDIQLASMPDDVRPELFLELPIEDLFDEVNTRLTQLETAFDGVDGAEGEQSRRHREMLLTYAVPNLALRCRIALALCKVRYLAQVRARRRGNQKLDDRYRASCEWLQSLATKSLVD